jgi:hypothetical protein
MRPPSEVSHHGKHGTGTKPSDHEALPACRNCHWHWHNAGVPHTSWQNLSKNDKRDRFRLLADLERTVWRLENGVQDEPAESDIPWPRVVHYFGEPSK